MLESVKNIQTMRYDLKCSERINHKIRNVESGIKLQRSPRKIYLYAGGPELLWIEGKNNGNALVNPAAFPYINLNLDPSGNILHKDQHHTINEVGFDYLADIIQYIMQKSGDKFDKTFFYTGDEKFNGRDCYKITITNPDFTFNNYTPEKGESAISIARKFKVSEYMIVENNSFLKDFHDVKKGQVIKVPSTYAKLTVLFIDKQLMLPVKNTILDDEGLFEAYEYHNLQVNTKILDEEFTKDFKGYHF